MPPDGTNSSANSSKKPAAINTSPRVRDIVSIMCSSPVVHRPPGGGASNFLHDNAVALNLDHLDARARLNVAAFGHDIDELIAELDLPRRTKRRRGDADRAEKARQ